MKSKLFILDYKDLFNGPLIAFLVDDLWDHKDNLKQEQFVTGPTLKPVVITGFSAALGKTNVLDHLCLQSKVVILTVFSSQDAFTNLIRSYEYHREQLLILSRQIRQRVREYDNELYSLLKSISGIGPLTASALITELGDINRFSHIDDLSRIVGLIPRVRENSETIHTGGITFRCNSFLRTMLIEASWQAIRQGSSSYAILSTACD